MKFTGPLVVVNNMAVSRKFYETVLGQNVILDFGENITFNGGFSLQLKSLWCQFIERNTEDIIFQNNSFELYFEENDFDGFLKHIDTFSDIKLVHNTKKFPWGQRVIRFYDPDLHIIEVGESMPSVIKNFLKQGMSIEETAKITQHPIEFVKECMEH